MNLLIVFVLLAMLMISDVQGGHPVDDVWSRALAILATLAAVPAFAALQTELAVRKLRSQDISEPAIQRMLARLTVFHSILWVLSSLSIVYLLGWQNIVRGNWQLDRFPLLDEAAIIAPVIVSLVSSWFIFFDIQNVFSRSEGREGIRKRLSFVSLRVQVYVLVGLLPVLVVFAVRDLSGGLNGIGGLGAWSNSVPLMLTGTIVGLVLLLVLFPFMMLLVWRTSSLRQTELGIRLRNYCSECRLNVAQIRQWNTGGSIINAVVAGVLPFFRVILVSDGLMSKFDETQIRAILRHEAGHIRRWHLASRMVFILLPIVLIGACHLLTGSLLNSLESAAVVFSIPQSFVYPGVVGAYALYLVAVLVWLSWQMEYDADLYAVTVRDGQTGAGGLVTVCPQAADETLAALYRFVELMPAEFDRKTLWHPTLRKRLIRLHQVQQEPKRAQLNSDLFVHKQFLLFAAIVISFTSLQILLNVFGS